MDDSTKALRTQINTLHPIDSFLVKQEHRGNIISFTNWNHRQKYISKGMTVMASPGIKLRKHYAFDDVSLVHFQILEKRYLAPRNGFTFRSNAIT